MNLKIVLFLDLVKKYIIRVCIYIHIWCHIFRGGSWFFPRESLKSLEENTPIHNDPNNGPKYFVHPYRGTSFQLEERVHAAAGVYPHVLLISPNNVLK